MMQLFLGLLALAIAIILHEVAHGMVAYWLGDRTAQRAGRLSLNPIKHIDKTGSIILPLVLVVGQIISIGRVAFLYGWAKPVPVDPAQLQIGRYHSPRRLMAVVAAAGPAMNFLLAVLAGLAVHLAITMQSQDFLMFLARFIQVNLVLGLFNLIPFPPLDGGRIAVGILPLPVAIKLARLEKIGIAAVLLLLFILPLVLQQLNIQFDPLNAVLSYVVEWATNFILVLTGNNVGNS